MSDAVIRFQDALARITASGGPFELTNLQLDGVSCRIFRNAAQTVDQLVDQGRQYGDATFLVYQGERLSFNTFFRDVDTLAARLQTTLGVAKGDRLAIAMRNRPEWLIAFCAAVSIGAVVVPLNSWERRKEMVRNLANAEPKVLMCDIERLTQVASDLEALALTAVVVDEASAPNNSRVIRYAVLCAEPGTPVPVKLDPMDDFMILYTSGTTSGAKGVLIAHRAFCQAAMSLDCMGTVTAMTSPDKIRAIMSSGRQPSSLLAVPLFHTSGLLGLFIGAIKGGRKLVMMYKWDAGEALQLIEREKVTQISCSPAMVQQLLTAPHFANADTSGLFGVGFGGSATTATLIDLVFAKLPQAICGTGYGMTESSGVASVCTDELFRRYPRASGMVIPIMEMCCMDDLGNVLPRGAQGEICMRGVTVMRGYWRNEVATREVLRNGWLHTGDIGYIDEQDLVFVMDRIKDIVNRGGEKIATLEIESCICQMPGVAEATAFAVPDPEMGEALAVVVVPNSGTAIDASAIRCHIAAHLASFKMPAHVLIHVEALPRNASGKVIKRTLKETVLAAPVGQKTTGETVHLPISTS